MDNWSGNVEAGRSPQVASLSAAPGMGSSAATLGAGGGGVAAAATAGGLAAKQVMSSASSTSTRPSTEEINVSSLTTTPLLPTAASPPTSASNSPPTRPAPLSTSTIQDPFADPTASAAADPFSDPNLPPLITRRSILGSLLNNPNTSSSSTLSRPSLTDKSSSTTSAAEGERYERALLVAQAFRNHLSAPSWGDSPNGSP
ncbi:hypothetical protein DFS34DRAFT_634804 [Phlyctochytrium arcticum]|nr:hypothetical protein DFS34DRAFT_634804 [Phlyctochytrium arcticum]